VKWWAPALMSFVLVASAATAATEPRLASLEVALWPEYDRPAVLVMLHGRLVPNAALPATVHLPMPVEAGKPHAVAKRTPDGRLLLVSHTVSVTGESAIINVLTDEPEIWLEYYVDLATTDPQRRYVFTWPGGIDIAQVTYEVLQPIGAEGLSVKPPPGRQSVGNDGLTYYLGDLGPKGPNESFSIGVTYTKTTPTLTAFALPQQGAPVGQARGGMSPPPAATPSGPGAATPWLVALVIGFAVTLAGIWVFMASKKPQRKQ
jgi:hypothetical protein